VIFKIFYVHVKGPPEVHIHHKYKSYKRGCSVWHRAFLVT